MNFITRIPEKSVFRLVLTLSVTVFIAVIVLDSKILPRPDPVPAFAHFLPALNALLNACCSVLLVCSFSAIRKKQIETHKKLNLLTFLLSCVFLLSYVLYHWMSEETKFPAENPLRPVYLTILVSHIILAALVLPLVLFSFWLGLTNQVARHRKVAKWTFPIWLYVTTTGVIVYLMISPYYPG